MDTITALTTIAGIVLGVAGWLLRRLIAELDRRVVSVEAELRTMTRDLTESRTRVENLRQSDDDLKLEISYIREHMVRRDDFRALGERIDDVLKNQIPRSRQV